MSNLAVIKEWLPYQELRFFVSYGVSNNNQSLPILFSLFYVQNLIGRDSSKLVRPIYSLEDT